jgi:2-polyprenyl-3-methyl-5-hydroxy-6-metoxy-1,4-benzoquinol methylase
MQKDFDKYERRGPYHWSFISKNPFLHHCPTTARYKAIINSVPSWKGLKVVDIGCGDGALTYLLLRMGAEVAGVEPDPIGRLLAEREFSQRGTKVKFYESLEKLQRSYFDVAVCSEVIEHVEDPYSLLANISQFIQPEGIAVVSTPIRLTEKPIDTNHIQEFFPSEFEKLMKTSFAEVKVSFHIPMSGLMLYYWRPWFFLRRPLITYIMNSLDILFDINPVEYISALNRYHNLQVAVGKKLLTSTET